VTQQPVTNEVTASSCCVAAHASATVMIVLNSWSMPHCTHLHSLKDLSSGSSRPSHRTLRHARYKLARLSSALVFST